MTTLKKSLENLTLNHNYSLPEEDYPVKLVLLESFFGRNTLSRDVYLGLTSYENQIDFIKRKYSGLNKFFNPKEDPIFDSEVERIISSMNEVGASEANLGLYKTADKRKSFDFRRGKELKQLEKSARETDEFLKQLKLDASY